MLLEIHTHVHNTSGWNCIHEKEHCYWRLLGIERCCLVQYKTIGFGKNCATCRIPLVVTSMDPMLEIPFCHSKYIKYDI